MISDSGRASACTNFGIFFRFSRFSPFAEEGFTCLDHSAMSKKNKSEASHCLWWRAHFWLPCKAKSHQIYLRCTVPWCEHCSKEKEESDMQRKGWDTMKKKRTNKARKRQPHKSRIELFRPCPEGWFYFFSLQARAAPPMARIEIFLFFLYKNMAGRSITRIGAAGEQVQFDEGCSVVEGCFGKGTSGYSAAGETLQRRGISRAVAGLTGRDVSEGPVLWGGLCWRK